VSRASAAVSPPEAPRSDEPLGAPDASVETFTSGSAIERARIVDADLPGVRARGLRLTDVEIVRGNLANSAAPELWLRRVRVMGARLTGVQWTSGRIEDAMFRDCLVDLATFAGTTFDRVLFAGCRVAQSDLRDALLRSVRFEHCDLTEADLAGVRVDRCELVGCTLDGVSAVERLRGASMPWGDVVANAALFAGALGIRIVDGDGS
jgi:uncharacterized protein YjbI with pentapeptide repeats